MKDMPGEIVFASAHLATTCRMRPTIDVNVARSGAWRPRDCGHYYPGSTVLGRLRVRPHVRSGRMKALVA